MKVMISGSMTFVHDMVRLEEKLKKLGHTVCLPIGIKKVFTRSLLVVRDREYPCPDLILVLTSKSWGTTQKILACIL